MINETNNTDFMNINCCRNKLTFKSEKAECKPDVKVLKSNINFYCGVCIKYLVCYIDLEYDSAFLIIQDDIFQTAYRIKSFSIFYLNNWRIYCK